MKVALLLLVSLAVLAITIESASGYPSPAGGGDAGAQIAEKAKAAIKDATGKAKDAIKDATGKVKAVVDKVKGKVADKMKDMASKKNNQS